MDLLITGSTGSLGTALLNALTGRLRGSFPFDRIICFSRGEHRQAELAAQFQDDRLRWFIGDVRDQFRLEQAMRGVHAVIHAAALKRVEKVAYDVREGILTNVDGTANVIHAAINSEVEKVLVISSDKAVSSSTAYGSTKMLAECLAVAMNAQAYPQGTKVACTRYGNVVGSQGSVIPQWRALIRNGSPLPITSSACTRFWITLPVAVDFVLRALTEFRGGEIFVPKLCAVQMVDVAEALAPGQERENVGLRPGEKIHEELLNHDELRRVLDIDWSYVVEPPFNFWGAKPWQGFRPPRTFHQYRSDKVRWLTVDEIRTLLQEVP